MKNLLLLVLILMGAQTYAQFKTDFDPTEAKEMIMLCNGFTFEDLYGSDKDIIPKTYTKTYISPVYGMDNKYQIFENEKFGVICFRGSINKQMSWIENFYSSMISANGSIKIDSQKLNYSFATEEDANIHAGYALSIVLISEDIISQIKRLNEKGIFNIIITGHSQGGALAQMLRAYLENLPSKEVSSENKFKTYAFASPMIGNEEFSTEYNIRFSSNKSSFAIVNPKDMVTRLPITSNEGHFISSKNVENFLSDSTKFDYKSFLIGATMSLFENKIASYVDWMGNSMEKKLVVGDSSKIEMPNYQRDIHYFMLDKTIIIPPAIYPLEGKEPAFYQHKPYNYYVTILKTYFPEEYNSLEHKNLTKK